MKLSFHMHLVVLYLKLSSFQTDIIKQGSRWPCKWQIHLMKLHKMESSYLCNLMQVLFGGSTKYICTAKNISLYELVLFSHCWQNTYDASYCWWNYMEKYLLQNFAIWKAGNCLQLESEQRSICGVAKKAKAIKIKYLFWRVRKIEVLFSSTE